MLSVIILSVIMLSVVMMSVIKLNIIMLNAIILSIIKMNVIKMNVIMLSVIMLNVIMLSVMAPSHKHNVFIHNNDLRKRVFVIAIHLHFSLIYLGKAKNLLLEQSPVRGSMLVGSSLSCKY